MSKANHHTSEKMSQPTWKRWAVIGCVSIIVAALMLLIINVGYQTLFQIPNEKQAELEIEFKAIIPLKSARLVRYTASNKPVHSLVSAHYLTDAASSEIFKYYDEELKRHGWQLIEIKKVKVWDRDLGGKSAIYCKGEYAADLYYAGQDAPDKLTYSLGLSWNMDDCKKPQGDQNN